MYIVQLYKKINQITGHFDFMVFTMRYHHFRRSGLGLYKMVQFVSEFRPSSRIVSIVHVHQPRKKIKSFFELGRRYDHTVWFIPYYQISLVKVQNYSHCLFSSKVTIGDGEPCLLSPWILERAMMLQEIQRFRPELTLCLVNLIKTNEFIGI